MPDDVVEVTSSTVGDDGTENPKARREQRRLFGEEFPGVSKDGKAWRRWIDARLREQESTMRDKRLHWARHRHFWQGRQWISSRDGRTWREVNADDNEVKQTLNLVGPALDYRIGLVAEQRPGFKTEPLGSGVEGQEMAEAQQRVAEHYYNKLKGLKLMRDAQTNAQTDGACFLHVYVDKAAGPKREDVRLVPPTDPRYSNLKALGYEVRMDGNLVLPLNEEGQVAGVGTEVRTFNEGDIATRLVLAHEAFFDPEARTVNGPYDKARWCIIRRVRDVKSARIETGDDSLESEATAVALGDPVLDTGDLPGFPTPTGFQRGLPPFPSTRLRPREQGVFDFLVYVAPNEAAGMPNGMYRRVIGDKVVEDFDELPGGRIPLARMTDGSADNEMFPRPVMMQWVPDQITINAIVSVLLQHIRIFGLGRMMAQKGTVINETYTSIVGSLLEYTGQTPQFQQGVHASGDVWRMLDFFVKKLEDKTGWGDLARGAMGGASLQDVSGRALLGAKELFERVFGPLIRATAEGMSEWACLIVDYARWLFQTPRLIPVAGRSDLAKKIKGEDLGEESVVYIDPRTMTPLPAALRHQMLFDMMQQGLISKDVYMKNAPFGEIRDIHYGGQEQWQRAQWVNMILEERWQELVALDPLTRFDPATGGVAMWWQDEPEVHKEALQQIMLDERKPLELRDLAAERWGLYDQLERAKGKVGPQGESLIPPGSAPPPAQVRGAPPDIAMQFGLPVQAAMPLGTGAPQPGSPSPLLTSPAPDLSPQPTEASQQTAMPLGEFGIEEQLVQDQQEF